MHADSELAAAADDQQELAHRGRRLLKSAIAEVRVKRRAGLSPPWCAALRFATRGPRPVRLGVRVGVPSQDASPELGASTGGSELGDWVMRSLWALAAGGGPALSGGWMLRAVWMRR
jgi:hypothetical protein